MSSALQNEFDYRNMKNNRPKKKNRSVLRLKRGIKLLSVVFFLTFGVFVAVHFFVVRNVQVEGNVLYDSKVIQETVLSDRYSWNSLYVFLKYHFFQKDGELPFIDTMEISLKNPQTIHIKVYEKGMMGCVKIEDGTQIAYFDKDGFVVEISQREIEDVPEILGIQCEEVVLLEKLPIEEADLKEILILTQKLKGEELIPEQIVYNQEGAPIVHYGNLKVQLGSLDNLTQKVTRMKKIFPTLEGESGVLHLEKWDAQSPNIVFDKEK